MTESTIDMKGSCSCWESIMQDIATRI